MKSIFKKWLPPIIHDYVQKIRYPLNSFSGDYNHWADALDDCHGYNDPIILEKVLAATLRVKNGDAAFERDSIAFEAVEIHWPILATLMSAAARNRGKLNVLDFGGSLGSKYFQHIKLLKSLDELSWNIVEQASYVTCGREHIQDDVIKFYDSIADCKNGTDVILLSSVLQYIEDPGQLIEELEMTQAKQLIIDKTPMTDLDAHRLVKQQIPSQIYKGSYPAWLFSRKKLMDTLEPNWKLTVKTPTSDRSFTLDTKTRICFEGMILERR